MTDPTQWQDLTIFAHKAEDISAIEIVREGQPTLTLERDKEQKWALPKGDGKVKRLFENYADIERAYYRQTKIFPIMHTVVIRREVYEANRWIAQSLTKAFMEAQRKTYEDLYETAALKAMLPWLTAHVEDARKEFGNDWWSYGLENNANVLETFTRYHHEQGLSPRKLSPQELFAPESLEAFKI